jgi:CRISPR-associated protein Csm2
MRSHQGPHPGQPQHTAQRPPGGQGRGNVAERIKELLRHTEGVAYVSAQSPGSGFLDADARSQAEKFSQVAPSQLRRFYDRVTGFKRRLELDTEVGDSGVQAQMAYLKASAAYAAARNQRDELALFFIVHANSVKTRQHYFRFCQHFEAVVAYHKIYGRERGN